MSIGSYTVVLEELLHDVNVLGRQGSGQSCLALRRKLKALRVEYDGDPRKLEGCKLTRPSRVIGTGDFLHCTIW